MKVAFIGHSHHRTTGSSSFFLDLLRRQGAAVETFWDQGWLDGTAFDLEQVVRGRFDAVVVWQVESLASRLAAAGLPNVTFFPMYDGCYAMPDAYWRSMREVKVVCFSSVLHERLQGLGLRTRFVRYFPDPAGLAPVEAGPGLAGYFWQRQQDVTWRTIQPLLGDTRFERFTLHRALDPSYGEFVAPTPEEAARHRVRISSWFPDRAEAQRDLARHNVYFAPRLREGIGMSFLEAMATGFLVVAPDRPTMNEYLVSGVNGLLYDPDDPRPLDFSRARELGARARRTVEQGFARWSRCAGPLLRLLELPTASVPPQARFDALDPCSLEVSPATQERGTAGPPRPPGGPLEGGERIRRARPRDAGPAVTVAVVTRNAAPVLRPTLESIHRQDFTDRDLILLDGASTDGTVDVIRQHDAAIEYWRSGPDGGPYEAMNEAARLADGRYILFMNAGDAFHSTDSLRLAMEGAPADADVIYGHHVYRKADGREELHQAAAFEETWATLQAGAVGWRWLARVPGHQATLTRTELLRRHPYRTELRIAADHDLLYRLAREGARFHHAGWVLATYVGGGLSWKNRRRCFEEWRRLALEHGGRPDLVTAAFDAMGADMERDLLQQLPWRQLVARALVQPLARGALGRRLRGALPAWDRLRYRLRRTRRKVLELGGAELGARARRVEGLSPPESWGRWSEGERVVIELREPVHRPRGVTFRVRLAYGPNVGKELGVLIGRHRFARRLAAGEQRIRVKLGKGAREAITRVELIIPAPASPRDRGESDDARLLGVALRSVEFESRRW
jgi:hypothetical protein